jgi:Ca2+-binding RTX toxin-like protein
MNISAHSHQRKTRLAILLAALTLAGGALAASAEARGVSCGSNVSFGAVAPPPPPGGLTRLLPIYSATSTYCGSAATTEPACTIVGTPGRDVLVGTAGRDVICGRGGDDVILGRGGDDLLRGGSGNDRLIGGGGSDRLEGGSGDDILIALDRQRDLLDGGVGRDRAHADRSLDTRISVELGY